MAFHFGGKIVEDGLVFYLDAANSRSYVSGSTVWRDLTQNNYSGSLINGPTFSSANAGSIMFDGIDDYVDTTFNEQLGDFTAAVWFKSTANNLWFDRVVDKNYETGFWIGRNFNVANSWGGGVKENTPPNGRFITLNDNEWHYIVSTRSGTTHTIYGDGITNTISGTVASAALSNSRLYIGKQIAGLPGPLGQTGELTGNVGIVKIYNRALSAQEVLQNYNALRGRYGL